MTWLVPISINADAQGYGVDSRGYIREADRKANPKFPDPTPNQTRTPAKGAKGDVAGEG